MLGFTLRYGRTFKLLLGWKIALTTAVIAQRQTQKSTIMMSQSVGQSSTTDGSNECRRLLGVQGYLDKQNDVVFYGDPSQKPQHHIVFFGGDVQVRKESIDAKKGLVKILQNILCPLGPY